MLDKIKNGYLLYIIVDGIQIKIDGWFTAPKSLKMKYDYYQWIGMCQ